MLKQKGLTLIEMLIVVAIIAILTASAAITYRAYARKGNRSDAIQTLLSMQLAQERYRTNNSTYGTLAQVWGSVTATSNGYYTLSITSVGSSSYTLNAVAAGSQVGDTEGATACGTLQLIVSAGTDTKSPSACWMSN